MIEHTISLKILPGVYRNGTEYQSKGRWFDSHLVRWSQGIMGPIGGWKKAVNSSNLPIILTLGKPRGAYAWVSNALAPHFAAGTHLALYAYPGGLLDDITPASFVAGKQDGHISVGVSSNYGSGNYGAGPYSVGAGVRFHVDADTWQFDNFGQILVACFTADGRLLQWALSGDATALTGGAPLNNRALVVTPERFLFALGADGNPRKVKWPSRESLTDWPASDSNTAGDYELATAGYLKCGRRLKTRTLLFTSVDVWSAEFIGGQFIYGFAPVGSNCGIISPNAVSVVGNTAFWMGDKQFYRYDGATHDIPCEVADFVFNDLNLLQRAKIFSVALPEFSEVTWYYPSISSGSPENDRYVTHNYAEGTWAIGKLARAAGFPRESWTAPVLITPGGTVYEHETGSDYEGEVPFAESGPVEVGEGERIMRVQYVVPDEKTSGSVQAEFFARTYPTAPEVAHGPFLLSKLTPVRFSARQVRVRLSANRGEPLAFANTDFEQPVIQPFDAGSGWAVHAGSEPLNFALDTINPLGGDRSLRVLANIQDSQRADNLISLPVLPGESFSAEAVGKVSQGALGQKGHVEIIFRAADATPLSQITLEFTSMIATKVFGSGIAPENTDHVTLDVLALPDANTGFFTIDDIKVFRSTSGGWRVGTFRLGALPGDRR